MHMCELCNMAEMHTELFIDSLDVPYHEGVVATTYRDYLCVFTNRMGRSSGLMRTTNTMYGHSLPAGKKKRRCWPRRSCPLPQQTWQRTEWSVLLGNRWAPLTFGAAKIARIRYWCVLLMVALLGLAFVCACDWKSTECGCISEKQAPTKTWEDNFLDPQQVCGIVLWTKMPISHDCEHVPPLRPIVETNHLWRVM